MPIIKISLDLIDYIDIRLHNPDLTKREENSLKMLKGVICDFVCSRMQERKEKNYVTE